MIDSNAGYLSKDKLNFIKQKWSNQDQKKGNTWEFDGIPLRPDHWMGYNHEMKQGLTMFGCETFDDLVVSLGNTINRKPNVVDLMGGAYFLNKPENTGSFVGIRVHDKDQDFKDVYGVGDDELSKSYLKITKAPNRKIIEADILTNSGWNTIKGENLSADLLVCRPVGPFDREQAMVSKLDNPQTYIGLYASLFKRMVSLVNRKTGVIFTEIPDIFPLQDVTQFFKDFDSSQRSQTKIFTVPDEDYQWYSLQRRYAVVQFGEQQITG